MLMFRSLEKIFGTWRIDGPGQAGPKHIDLVQATAYLESGGGGELENINIEREAINLERKLVKNTLAYNNNLPESNQEKDFQNFDMDYFGHFR